MSRLLETFLAATSHTWIVPAMVDRVIDGDTIACHVHLMPGMMLHGEPVRVQGINAPEMGTAAGRSAKEYVERLLSDGDKVTLSITHRDKYGRVLARIKLADGSDLSARMIAAGHAVAYMT